MKFKKVLATVVMLSLLVTSNIYMSVDAAAKAEDYGINPLGFCVEEGCSSMLPIVTICTLEERYEGSHTHKYGFLWQKSCTIQGYNSSQADYCPGCGRISEIYGDHYCLEKHDSCGVGDNGNRYVCPFGGKL